MKKQLFILLSAFFLTFLSCKKESPSQTSEPYVTSTSLAGFGDRGGTPSGYFFYLPNNVKVITSIVPWDTAYLSYEQHGLGQLGSYFTLENFNNFSTTINFPAGLIILPDNDSSQSGLNIYPVKVILAPKATKKISLYVMCMNHHKPARSTDIYTMNIISNNDQVYQLIDALKFKSDSTLYKHGWALQDIVWDISDSTGLSKADLDSIKSW